MLSRFKLQVVSKPSDAHRELYYHRVSNNRSRVLKLALVAAILLAGCEQVVPETQAAFVQATWLSDVDARAAMITDLQHTHLSPGLPAADVEKLLGPREDRAPSGSPASGEWWFYELALGPCFDTRMLMIEFDAAGRLVETTIICN